MSVANFQKAIRAHIEGVCYGKWGYVKVDFLAVCRRDPPLALFGDPSRRVERYGAGRFLVRRTTTWREKTRVVF